MIVNGDLDVTGNIDMAGTTSLKIAATAKLYLDGGGDTYLVESAANTVDLYTNGAIAWTTNTTGLTLGSGLDLVLLTTKKLKFNVGGTAYAYESAADVIDIYAASTNLFTIDGATSFVKVNAGIDFSIAATKKLYLDGGTDTYIYESAANTVGIYTNATLALQASTTLVSIGSARDLAVVAAKKIYLDGGGDTYITESSANTVGLFVGGSSRLTTTPSAITVGTGVDFTITNGDFTITSGDIVLSAAGSGGSAIEVYCLSGAMYIEADTSSNTACQITTYHNSISPADDDKIFRIISTGNNDAAAEHNYGTMQFVATDVSDTTEDSVFEVYLSNNGSFVSTTPALSVSHGSGTYVRTDIFPYAGNTQDLGSVALDWDNIYSVNALNVTSDKRLKTDIENINIGIDFIKDLSPVFYKWKESNKREFYTKESKKRDGTIEQLKRYNIVSKTAEERRLHAGFIAQDVEKVLKKHEVDFGVLCYDKEADKYTMRYDELLPIFAKAIQELSTKIEALEKKGKK